MTEQELLQENEKLTARLKKAVEVFNDQKSTIARQAEEIESLRQKAAEGEKKDNEFFDQITEIETLKADLSNITEERDKANERVEKAGVAYKKLQEELDNTKQLLNAEKEFSQNLSNKINKLKNIIDE